MFNLIKMDIHRLLHSKSTWIMICFVIGLAVFSVTMTNSDIEFMKDNPAAVTETMEERPVGIYVEAQPEWVNGTIEIGSVVSVEMRSQLLAMPRKFTVGTVFNFIPLYSVNFSSSNSFPLT